MYGLIEAVAWYKIWQVFLTRAKSRLVRYVIEVLIDFINSVMHFFNNNKLFKRGEVTRFIIEVLR